MKMKFDPSLEGGVERMKERMLKNFLKSLNDLAFVQSRDSITGQIEELNPVIKDMEEIIEISGQFDREDLKNLIVSISG